MRKLLALFAVLAAGLLLGSDSPKDWDDRAEQDRIEGTWRVVQTDGKLGRNGDSMTFHRGRFIWHEGGDIHTGTYLTFPDRRPAGLDLINEVGPLKGRPWLGVYKIEGNTLHVATRSSSDDRPDSLTGPGLSTWVLKRERK